MPPREARPICYGLVAWRSVLAWAVLLLMVGAASAETKPLQLVTGPDYKPFTDLDLPQGGMDSEIVVAAFAASAVKTVLTFQPWQRGFHDTLTLIYDATFPYSRTAEREQDFLYSDSFYELVNRPFVLAGAAWQATQIKDLAGRTMCSPDGYAVIGPVEDLIADGSLRVERPKNMTQCFAMLKLGRVDFVYSIDEQTYAIVLSLFGDVAAVKSLEVEFSHVTNSLIVSRQHPHGAEIIAAFNQGLRTLRQNGRYQEIVTRHLQKFYAPGSD